ncbi:hypothetical protein DRO91_05660 [Candidatus Heimdallarchaeota archaeon]|nr:MAG: hypothetical protein DRO91_05660 [Candidatus Heimdallarchaeota archaeon]
MDKTAKLSLIKLARMYKRITLAEIEGKLIESKRIKKYAYTRIENGIYAATPKTQKQICEILDLKRSAAFTPTGKARVLRWKHVLKIQKMLIKKEEKK